MAAISFYYRIDKHIDSERDRSGPKAAQMAKELFLTEWGPSHWHLDTVSETADFINVSFSGVINMDNWQSADAKYRDRMQDWGLQHEGEDLSS